MLISQELYKSIRNLKKDSLQNNDNNSVVINYLQNMIPKYNL